MDIELADELTVRADGRVEWHGQNMGHIAYVTNKYILRCWKSWLEAE